MRCDEGIAWVAFVVHNFNDFDYIYLPLFRSSCSLATLWCFALGETCFTKQKCCACARINRLI